MRSIEHIDRGGSVHGVFEAQVERGPDRVAVAFGAETLTYRELNARANQLAHHLRLRGVGPEVLVGICLDRGLDLVIGILGILKAGGAYVPIDPQYPPERRNFMLEDSNASVFVTQATLTPQASAASGASLVLLDAHRSALDAAPVSNPGAAVNPDHLAYVIYTSGSTGKPKGTLISHRNVVRLFAATDRWFGFDANDVWTLFHSYAFDFSVWEMWGALFYGGRLVVVPFSVSRAPAEFHRLLCDEGVTVLNQTPSAFRQLSRADENAPAGRPLQLRYIVFGGEALDFKSLGPWFSRHGDRRPQLVNMYGITETTVHVTYRPLKASDIDSGSVIGVPIPDLTLHVLDSERRPVRIGEAGEIYVGGAGVARGYLNRPELTAQRFIRDPFSASADDRLYRTGDSGRPLANGDLEYQGRIDQQVKIRGFRIELGEIKAEIDRAPGVRESVVVVRETASGDKSLAAYVVCSDGAKVQTAALRDALRMRLPEYMVPGTFTWLDRLPLTVNGKLDTGALPIPGAAEPVPAGADRPGSRLENDIQSIWQDVLGVTAVGLDQNFFDVGGNSMLAAEVHVRLQTLLAMSFPITDLFAHSTIRAIAARFSAAAPPEAVGRASTLRAQRQRETLASQRNRRLNRQ